MTNASLTGLHLLVVFLFVWTARGNAQDSCYKALEYNCTIVSGAFCGWEKTGLLSTQGPSVHTPSSHADNQGESSSQDGNSNDNSTDEDGEDADSGGSEDVSSSPESNENSQQGSDRNETMSRIFRSPKFCDSPPEKKHCVVVVQITQDFHRSPFQLSAHVDNNNNRIFVFPLISATLVLPIFKHFLNPFYFELQSQYNIQTSNKTLATVRVMSAPIGNPCWRNQTASASPSITPLTMSQATHTTFPTTTSRKAETKSVLSEISTSSGNTKTNDGTTSPGSTAQSNTERFANSKQSSDSTTALAASVTVVVVAVVVIMLLFVLIRRRRRHQPLCMLCLKKDSSKKQSNATSNAAYGLRLEDSKQFHDEENPANFVTPQSDRTSQTLEHEYSVITNTEANGNYNLGMGNIADQNSNNIPSQKSPQSAYASLENNHLSQTPEHVYSAMTNTGHSHSSANPGVENSVDLHRNEQSSSQSATVEYNKLNFHNAGRETVATSETKGDYNHLPPPAETETGTGNEKPEATSVYHCLEEDDESCPKEIGDDANKSHLDREQHAAENSQLSDISSTYHILEDQNAAVLDLSSDYSLQKPQNEDDALYCLERQQQPQQPQQQQQERPEQEEDNSSAYHILEDESAPAKKDPTPFTYELAKADGFQNPTDFQEEKEKGLGASSMQGDAETLTDYHSLDFDGEKKDVAETTDVYNHLNEDDTDMYNELQRANRKDIVDNEYSRVA